MPILSIFFGIIVRIYHGDHNPPHIHVEYAEFRAVIEIDSGKTIKGRLPKRAKTLLEEWRRKHKRELKKAWNDAQAFRMPKKIKPLE